MTDQVKFEVVYSEHEFVRGMLHAQRRAGFSWSGTALSVISVTVGFGLVYWFTIREHGPLVINDVFVGVAALIFSVPVTFALDRFKPSVENSLSRTFRQNSIYQEKFSVSIDNLGIDSRSDSFESLIRWDAFSSAFESDDDFYFILSDSQPIYFPKRAFTPEEMADVRRIASDQMTSKAKFLH